jgi:hypothetical protein
MTRYNTIDTSPRFLALDLEAQWLLATLATRIVLRGVH